MTTITIVTNHQYRPILSSYDLPKEALKEFYHYYTEQLEQASFFKYKGIYYDLSNFMRTKSEEFKGWDGVHSDSYFSGILIKLSKDCESVIVGRYYS